MKLCQLVDILLQSLISAIMFHCIILSLLLCTVLNVSSINCEGTFFFLKGEEEGRSEAKERKQMIIF